MSFTAVILAGGQSRRMGRDKAFIELEGRTLLARLLETARRAGAEELFISGRPGVDYGLLAAPVLLDLEPGFGPLGGIERGLEAATFPLVLFLAVDLPGMTSDFLRKMRARCDRLTGIIPKRNRGLEPLAAFYPKRCHAIALEQMCKFRRPARDFAEACLREHAVKTLRVERAQFEFFRNWNEPRDLAAASQKNPTQD